MTTKSYHIGSGLFIPDSLLKEAGIENNEVEIEISDNQIRITSPRISKKLKKGVINQDSEFWKLIGLIKTPGVDGREHDQYLYNTQ
ncbi:MAG: hypothetical protein JXA44_11665 [Methanospirillaceae archaeon]|nr:hypothetical protein [Methanospirillaceae archaeon]